MRRRRRGFTLLELLVVIVIIGMLAAYVAPRYFGQLAKSKVQVARAQIESLDKAVVQYRIDTGHYPGSDQGLMALLVRPDNEPLWRGAYLKKNIPIDPWGGAYVYTVPGGDGRDFDLVSYGNNGKPGGVAEDADVTNQN